MTAAGNSAQTPPAEDARGQGRDIVMPLSSNLPSDEPSRSRGVTRQVADTSDTSNSLGVPSGRGKRKRILLACRTCRTRKQRCDGLQPQCSHCTLQKLDCCYESASRKADVSQLYVHNLLKRIEHLEGELDEARPQNRNIARRSHGNEQSIFLESSPMESTPPPQAGQEHEVLPDSPNSGHGDFAQQPPLSYQGDDTRMEPQSAYPTPDTMKLPAQCYLGPASNISFLQTLLTPNQEQQQQQVQQQQQQQQQQQHHGTGMTAISMPMDTASQVASSRTFASLGSLVDAWPQRHLGDHLVDCYMKLCYPQYQFIHGPTLQKRYESIWTAKERQSNVWTATVNMVFALGCQFSPDIAPQLGQEFFKKATSLIDFNLLGSGTLETLQALILMSLYLQSSPNLNSSWDTIGLAVRQAQSLGLHLSKTYKSSWTPLAREVRKRAWWACYVLDSVSGVMLGRPQMISDDSSAGVDLPVLSDEELTMNGSQEMPSTPRASRASVDAAEIGAGGSSSGLAFFLATIRLSGLMREITKVYDCAFDHWRVLDIDDRLCEWVSNISPDRQPETGPTVNDKSWPQRQVLISRFLNWRVVLHRPCVSQNAPDAAAVTPFRSMRSVAGARLASLRAELCTDAASNLIEHIANFYTQGLNSAWWYDLNYLFSASTVLLAQIPHQQQKADLHQHIVGLAMDVMRRMQASGKELAGEYLRMVEKLQQQQIAKHISSQAHLSGPYYPQHLTPAEPRNPGAMNDDPVDRNGGDAGFGHVREPMQFEGGEAQGMAITDSSAAMGETDLNALLESLSFPWNLRSEAMPYNDDFMSGFLDPVELNPNLIP